ncbi:MAG: hypothetical protein AABY22_06275 [Nanoarchaeota archaeon]
MTYEIKIEDIVFWLLIISVIAIVIWKLFGSPSDIAITISLALFIIGTEMVIWKYFLGLEKKTSISFIKIKYDINEKFNEMSQNFKELKELVKKK